MKANKYCIATAAYGGYLPRKVEPLFSTIWAVTEFTRKNGATQIVPGSHLWKKERQPKPDEIAYAEMKPGSVLFYTGTVLHGGGANQTEDETRVGLFLHYALNWLRQKRTNICLARLMSQKTFRLNYVQ